MALQHLNNLPLVRKVHEVLHLHGGQARLVGGVVRDALITGDCPDNPDLDMAMTTLPAQAMDLLKKAGLRVLPTGLDHGTITVFDKSDDSVKIELTTLRHDIATDGRHAEVNFNANWAEDAARRDFTINAIYLDQDGSLYDPFNGIDDLHQQKILFIGDADARIKEDYLRMLRFFRFNSRFGNGKPDQNALDAIRRNVAQVTTLSGERIAMEMDKIMALSSENLSLMVNSGISHYLTKNGFDLETYEKFSACFSNIFSPSLAGKYAALVPFGQVDGLADLLKVSNHRREALEYISSNIDDALSWPQQNDDMNFGIYAWRHLPHQGKPWAAGSLSERFCLAIIRSGQTPDASFLKHLNEWKIPEFPVKGRDLIDLGFEAGQVIGDVLSTLETHWVDHHFTPSGSDLLSLAKGLDRNAIKR